MTTGPGTGNWASLFETSPYLVHSVLAHEDSAFFGHSGFARWAIRDALVKNLKERRFVVGASTITMQLAKNLFLHREKYLARKVQEVLLTWWLESALDKARILELYLNVIEYGPAIYGIRQASEHYFGRDPEELSLAESAFLACILPNPKLYHQQYERRELSSSMKNRMRRLIMHMAARGRIDESALAEGLAEVDALGFHGEGDPLPPPRTLVGRATPLPFGLPEMWGDPEGWSDDEGGYEDEDPEGAPWVAEPL
jgi:membrane peptidoglycan carboxypeptidase